MPSIKRWFHHSLVGLVDEPAWVIDDAFERYAIVALRAAAWETGQIVWALRDHPHAKELFVRGLARSVGVASEGILI